MLTLDQLNAATADECVALLDGTYEHSSWIARAAAALRPFASLVHLKLVLAQVVREGGQDAQLALIRAHPELAGKAMVSQTLTAESRNEQGKAGLTDCTAEEFERIQQLNAAYNAKFGFPFILAVRGPRGLGLGKTEIIATLARRLHNHPDFERAECLRNIHRIAEIRLNDKLGHMPDQGNLVWDWAERLAVHSDPGFAQRSELTVTYLTDAHRAGRRLPFGIEVVGFSEEEGQRYKAVFLGSGALTGQFDMGWLEQQDADGISMRQAMAHAGLKVADIAALQRDPARYLGFVEVHIEQGPVLNAQDMPLGIVTSINGSVRYLGEVIGMASHAGTTPMDQRRDAAVAVAELALFAEKRAASVPQAVATMGMLHVPNGSMNVVPGRCTFSLDVRATTDAVRDACAADIRAALVAICARRGLHFELEETMRAAAAPSGPVWQQRWERAVQALGLPLFHLPSGAGHDAMKLHEIMPQAMLFVRGLNAGISHNPLESITSDDADLCVRAFSNLLDQLATEPL